MQERQKALEAKYLYNAGVITREEAAEMIEPYKNLFNQKSKELAKKYGMKPKKFSLAAFLR